MFVNELYAKMAAASGVIHVSTDDEVRLETKCLQAAKIERCNVWRWTYSDGLEPISGNYQGTAQDRAGWKNVIDPVGGPQAAGLLTSVKEWREGPSIVIAYDLFTMINRLPTLPMASRLIKDITLAQQNPKSQASDEKTALAEIELATCQLVVCDAQSLEIETPVHRLELEMPTRQEMEKILDEIIATVDSDEVSDDAAEKRDKILNAMAGLPAYQAANAISEAISRTSRIDSDVVRNFKKELVAGKGVTWIDADPRGFKSLGGLDPIKSWMKRRAFVMLNETTRKEYGLSNPKALICAGVPGTGKSAGAKALASELGVPLLRVDFGELRDKYVGDSEKNLRDMLSTVAAAAPCVMHIDEVEKGLGGGGENTEADGGTGNRMLGAFLTWMQENDAQIFIYMTANRPDRLPPELLRAGRTSGQFWFDLPSTEERESIVQVFQKKYPKTQDVDVAQVVEVSDRCTGAEIETAFEEASVSAMIDSRDVTTEDIVTEIKNTSKVIDKFEMTDTLRKWKESAQPANSPEKVENNATTPISKRVRRVRKGGRK